MPGTRRRPGSSRPRRRPRSVPPTSARRRGRHRRDRVGTDGGGADADRAGDTTPPRSSGAATARSSSTPPSASSCSACCSSPPPTRTPRAEMLRVPGCHLSANDSSQVECDNRAVVTVNDTVYETEFGLFAGLSIVFTLLYFALVEGLTGGSLGKHMTGLRVVTPEGATTRVRTLAGALGAVRDRRPAHALHLRDHHVGGVGGPPPTRRHGREHLRGRASRRRPPGVGAPALMSADRASATRRSGARRSTSHRSGSSASRPGVNHCASTIS